MKKAMFHHVTPYNLRILQLDETLFEVDNFHSRYVDDAISTVDAMMPHLRQEGLFQPLFGFFEESDEDADDLITLEIGQRDILKMFEQLRWTHERCSVEFAELCYRRLAGVQDRNVNVSTEYADALAIRLEWLVKLMTAFGIALRKEGSPIFITNDATFKVDIEEDDMDADDADEDDREDDDDDADYDELENLLDSPDTRYEVLRNVSFKDLRRLCKKLDILPAGSPQKTTLLNTIVDHEFTGEDYGILVIVCFAKDLGIELSKPFTQEQRVENYILSLMSYTVQAMRKLARQLKLSDDGDRQTLMRRLATSNYNRQQLRYAANKVGFKLDI